MNMAISDCKIGHCTFHDTPSYQTAVLFKFFASHRKHSCSRVDLKFLVSSSLQYYFFSIWVAADIDHAKLMKLFGIAKSFLLWRQYVLEKQRNYRVQEEANRGKPEWEHLDDDLHVLLQCEDTENRAKAKLKVATDHVKRLLVPAVSDAKLNRINLHLITRSKNDDSFSNL